MEEFGMNFGDPGTGELRHKEVWHLQISLPSHPPLHLGDIGGDPCIGQELGGIIQQVILTLEWHATLMLARRQLDIYPGYGGVGTRDIRGVYHPVPQHSCAVYSRVVDTGYLHREREEGKITGTDMVVGIGGG